MGSENTTRIDSEQQLQMCITTACVYLYMFFMDAA